MSKVDDQLRLTQNCSKCQASVDVKNIICLECQCIIGAEKLVSFEHQNNCWCRAQQRLSDSREATQMLSARDFKCRANFFLHVIL